MKGRRDVNARRRQRNPASPTGPRWIYGINAIERRLTAQPGTIREVCIMPAPGGRRPRIAAAAVSAGIPVREADGLALERLTGTSQHQGVAAQVSGFEYADVDTIILTDPGPLLILDQVQDPNNLGALIRTAAAVGMAGVIIPRHGAAGVTPAAEKVAAGAAVEVPVCLVGNLHRLLLDLRDAGYWSIALSPRGGQSLFQLDLPARPALVLGGETGLRPLVAATCDIRASIPQRSGVESLNASVAGAVAMYEVSRRLQRLDTL